MREKLPNIIINNIDVILIIIFVICGLFFSTLIPPIQSPDESEHITRAYLLSKGEFILNAPRGKASGGMIDTGLDIYIATHLDLRFMPEKKISANKYETAKKIEWTGNKKFREAHGIAYYFPLVYLPQAIGLTIGEKLRLTVDASYHMARLMAIMAIAIILYFAFNIYHTNPLTIALLIIPMSIFQFSTSSLDGISTALSIYSISVFLRIVSDKINSKPWLYYSLAFSVFLVVSCRAHLLPLLLFVLVACFYTKRRMYFLIFIFTLLAVIIWLSIASITTVDLRVVTGASTSTKLLFYFKNPTEFYNVLLATLTNYRVNIYRETFIGVLGWLDTRFSPQMYNFISSLLCLIGVFSISLKNLTNEWIPRVLLFCCAVTSAFLIFFALLVTWTPYPATNLIHGVQGRYFLVPLIMFAYGISGGIKLHEGIFRKIALLLIGLLGVVTISSTTNLLLQRYYLSLDGQPEHTLIVTDK